MARVKLGEEDDHLVITEPDAVRPPLMPVDQMQPNPENPRPTDLQIEGMVESLKQGQLHNINLMSKAAFLARKPYLADKLTEHPYVVVTGRRRLEAAPRAGHTALKYEVHDEWTEDQIDAAVVSENEDRLDVNPLHLGRYLARMEKRLGGHRKVARALGRSQPWVSQRIGLTYLHEDLQDAIDAGRILFALARECTRLAPELQPRLASGELPPAVANAWLVTLKLTKEEQLERWAAGPPFDVEPTPESVSEADMPEDPEDGESERTNKPRAIIIRITERSPSALAGALRAKFSDEEITELVEALTSARE